LPEFSVFSSVVNHVEAVAVTGLMPCTMPAASVGGAAHAAWGSPGSGPVLRRGPHHQNGETVTRMVITILVRPGESQNQRKISLKTHFSAWEARRGSAVPPAWPCVAPPHIPAVRSRSELVPLACPLRSPLGPPLGPSGGTSFVRFRRSSTNPNPRA